MSMQESRLKSEVNWREFTSFACLLSLRNGGQLDPTAVDGVDELDELDDINNDDSESVKTTSTDLIVQPKLDGLRKRFLDRLAELLANERGGTHVSSAIMSDQIHGERVDIWVARNCGFEKRNGSVKTADEALLDKLQLALRSCSQESQPSSEAQSKSIVQEFWQAALLYYSPRLKEFRKDLKNCFQSNKSRVKKCLGKDGRALTEAQRAVQTALRDILEECHRPGHIGSTPALEPLVMKCFQMRQLIGAFPLLESILEKSATAKKLYGYICFLGRIRSAYYTFLALATTFPASTQITIHCVPKPKPLKIKYAPLTMLQTFGLLQLDLSEFSFRKHINSKMTLSEGAHLFESLQKERAHVHAEIQLLHHAIKHELQDLYPFIGASKRSCFLCASFIKANGGFKTRGTHGHLYSKWYVPQIHDIAVDRACHIVGSLQKIQRSLIRQLRIPIAEPIGHMAESSIGLTEVADSRDRITDPTSSMARYCQQKAAQERNQAYLRRLQEGVRKMEEEERAKANVQSLSKRVRSIPTFLRTIIMNAWNTLTSNILRILNLKNKPDTVTEHLTAPDQADARGCFKCDTLTTRTCSKCSRGRYCSLRCEEGISSHHAFTCNIGRSINTADLLMQDCVEDLLPTDPQVEEDFGFHRLYNFTEKAKLFGLYRSLCCFHDVSAETLRKWQVSKTLVENIIATYSKVREDYRGGYYPWFLEHQYVLDGTMTREEALEDLAKTYNAEARAYLSPSDRGKRLEELEPQSKRSAFVLLMWALQGAYPPPAESGPYYDFGFCTCTDEYTESLLGGLYQQLFIGDKLQRFWTQYLPNLTPHHHELCTFEEFWRAYDAGKLIDLMDKKGFKSDREQFKNLEAFLNLPPYGWHPSVWPLQNYLNEQDREEAPRAVYLDYGFIHCDGYFETLELKKLYRRLLRSADHLELHKACVQGKLWSFATSCIQVDLRFEKIMRNFYPLPNYPYCRLQCS